MAKFFRLIRLSAVRKVSRMFPPFHLRVGPVPLPRVMLRARLRVRPARVRAAAVPPARPAVRAHHHVVHQTNHHLAPRIGHAVEQLVQPSVVRRLVPALRLRRGWLRWLLGHRCRRSLLAVEPLLQALPLRACQLEPLLHACQLAVGHLQLPAQIHLDGALLLRGRE